MGCKHRHCFLLLTDVGEALTERLMWLSFHSITEASVGWGEVHPWGSLSKGPLLGDPLSGEAATLRWLSCLEMPSLLLET